MNTIRTLAASLAIAATSLLVQAASAAQLYNIHAAPDLNSRVVYQLAGGTNVNFVCYTNDSANNEWWQLPDGNYILASSAHGRPSNACVGIGLT